MEAEKKDNPTHKNTNFSKLALSKLCRGDTIYLKSSLVLM